jgi:NTP pyrophosphatase (non-canonical NTP hydrolase)
MTFREFSEANRERCESPRGFNHAIGDWDGSDWMTAVVGEIGEAANIIKKLNRTRDGIPGNKEEDLTLRVKLRKELADAIIYLDLLCQHYNIDTESAVIQKFNEKSQEIGYSKLL